MSCGYAQTNKHFKPLPEEWVFELTHGINLEFWAQGLVSHPQYSIPTGGASVETWGSWSMHDPLPLQKKECLSVGVAATSSDQRIRRIVMAVVHHTLKDGELHRLGCITAILPYEQSFQRAWFYALRVAGHFVDLSDDVCIHVMSALAFEAWNKQKHMSTFWDLSCLVTVDQRARIRPIYVSQKQLKEIPLGGWSLRSRFLDATKSRLLRGELWH